MANTFETESTLLPTSIQANFSTPPGRAQTNLSTTISTEIPSLWSPVILPTNKTTQLVMQIFPPIIIVIGIVGNVLSLLVLSKAKNRHSSTAYFLITLAMSDLCILWMGPVQIWIEAIWSVDFRLSNTTVCIIHTYITFVSFQLSSWLLVAVTMERCIGVVLPHRIKQVSTRRNALVTIFAVLTGSLLFNIPCFYGFGECGPLRKCSAISSNKYFLEFIWPWIYSCGVYLVPFILLAVSNICIVRQLRKRGHCQALSNSSRSRLKADRSNLRSITITVILLSGVFFTCLTPASIYFVSIHYWADNVEVTWQQIFTWQLSHTVVLCVVYLNPALNFYLYCLSGSRFRRDTKDLLMCRRSTSCASKLEHIRDITTVNVNAEESTKVK